MKKYATHAELKKDIFENGLGMSHVKVKTFKWGNDIYLTIDIEQKQEGITLSYLIAKGKELKGYTNDYLYLQYDGFTYGSGDYILKSTLHDTVVCKFKRTEEEFLADLKPQIEAKKREIAIYKQNNGEKNPKLLEMINQCREDIISLLIKRDKITQKGTWRTCPIAYYQGKIEEWI